MRSAGRHEKLTSAHAKLLRETTITREGPGTILRDFDVMLAHIGPRGLPTAGKHHYLPLASLAELNSRMAQPLQLNMERPQMRSYPNLQGLYLVLRTSGLAFLTGTGSKSRLILDPAAMASWASLNDTERYFNLLEAWLAFSKPDVVCEKAWPHDGLWALRQIRESIPQRGRLLKDTTSNEAKYVLGADLFHATLAWMFGMINLEQGATIPGRTWTPARAKRTDWGDSLMTLIFKNDPDDLIHSHSEMPDINPDSLVSYGIFQSFVQPYQPEWRNNLLIPREEYEPGTYIFKVSLGSVWRRFALPDNCAMSWLASAILNAFGFDQDHLYSFGMRTRYGSAFEVNHAELDTVEEGMPADEIAVGEIPLSVGQTMDFHYDFGDDWHFAVLLERIDPVNKKLKRPRLLEKHGAPPPQYQLDESDAEDDGDEVEVEE